MGRRSDGKLLGPFFRYGDGALFVVLVMLRYVVLLVHKRHG